tara:strand:- start:698 stop:994 length:297 start_codon:yes stop_codon:yes gene_type:complete
MAKTASQTADPTKTSLFDDPDVLGLMYYNILPNEQKTRVWGTGILREGVEWNDIHAGIAERTVGGYDAKSRKCVIFRKRSGRANASGNSSTPDGFAKC